MTYMRDFCLNTVDNRAKKQQNARYYTYYSKLKPSSIDTYV